ncbi:SRPBCC domain-containing protein [Galactobacter valiniphilus]|uniref:SRPBCC domain-containing protein n=1 Tax=Galactobacter valiniphilus TaxID=2676122 RepID=UPI0037366E99
MHPLHETIVITATLPAPPGAVWEQLADPELRLAWTVPPGQELVYDATDFSEGGREHYRCGPAGRLGLDGEVRYLRLIPGSLLVHSELLGTPEGPLSAALLSWELEDHGATTRLRLCDQVTSFAGLAMIEGHCEGFAASLRQLEAVLASRA